MTIPPETLFGLEERKNPESELLCGLIAMRKSLQLSTSFLRVNSPVPSPVGSSAELRAIGCVSASGGRFISTGLLVV